MSEKQLTNDQKKRIKEITDEWEKEIAEMNKQIPEPDGKHLDGKRTAAHVKLQKKYMPLIQAIMRE